MSSLNESVSIVKHFCYKCLQAVDILTSENTCYHCGTGFLEEILPTPPKSSKQLVNSEVIDKDVNSTVPVSPIPNTLENCCICLQEMDGKTEKITKLGCDHSFHKQCVKDWFYRANNCPLCRSNVDVPSVVTPVNCARGVARRGRVIAFHRSRSPIIREYLIRRNDLTDSDVFIREIGGEDTPEAQLPENFQSINQALRSILNSPMSSHQRNLLASSDYGMPNDQWIFQSLPGPSHFPLRNSHRGRRNNLF